MNKQEIVQLKRTLHKKATLEEYGLSSVPEEELERTRQEQRRQEEERWKRQAEEEFRRKQEEERHRQEAEDLRRYQDDAEVRRQQEETARKRESQLKEAKRLRDEADAVSRRRQQEKAAREKWEEARRKRDERRTRKKDRFLMPAIILFLIILAILGWGMDQGIFPSAEELSGRLTGTLTGPQTDEEAGAQSAEAAGYVTPLDYGADTVSFGDTLTITNRIHLNDYIGDSQEIAVIPWPEEVGEERFQLSWDTYSLRFSIIGAEIRYAYEAYQKSALEYLFHNKYISSEEDAERWTLDNGETYYAALKDEARTETNSANREINFCAVQDRGEKGVFVCTLNLRYVSGEEMPFGLDMAQEEPALIRQLLSRLVSGVSFARGGLSYVESPSLMAAVTLRDASSGIKAVVSHGTLRYHGTDGTEPWDETVFWNSFEKDSPRSTKVTFESMKADSVEYTLQDTYYRQAGDYPVLPQNAVELTQDEVRSYTLNGTEVKAQLVHYLSSHETEYTEINAWIPLAEDVILTACYKVAHYDFGDYPEFVEDVDTLRANMDDIVTEMMGTNLKIILP